MASSPEAAARPSGPRLASAGLSDRLAETLRQQIESGNLKPGDRLPTEQALAMHYTVSRTVVREAVSRLRSMGLLVARQGSGVFVAPPDQARPLAFDAAVLTNLAAVLDVVEVRRALESEVAALAATRATAAQRRAIQKAMDSVDASVVSGSAGVDEDLAFHQAIAEASGNAQFPRLLRHLEQYLRQAMSVTRRNEALKPEYMAQVCDEHHAIVDAILRRDAPAAAAAAAKHMRQAARRLHEADGPLLAAKSQQSASKRTTSHKGTP
jgi:GntR family transcriptional repressor for pyruvate dehydrogenase complex